MGDIGAKVGPFAHLDGSVLDFVASSPCMGLSLDRKVQDSVRFTSGDARGADKGKHSRALRQWRVLERMTGTAGRHQAPTAKNCSNVMLVLRERLAADCQQCHALRYGLNNFGHGLRGPCRVRLRGRDLKGG